MEEIRGTHNVRGCTRLQNSVSRPIARFFRQESARFLWGTEPVSCARCCGKSLRQFAELIHGHFTGVTKSSFDGIQQRSNVLYVGATCTILDETQEHNEVLFFSHSFPVFSRCLSQPLSAHLQYCSTSDASFKSRSPIARRPCSA